MARVYASTGSLRPMEERRPYLDEIRRMGIDAVKIRVKYDTLEEDLAIVRGVRATVGDDFTIGVDANQGWPVSLFRRNPDWDLERATAFARGCDDLGVAWLLDEERRSACRMLGFGDGRDAFERLLDACDPGGDLSRRWQSSRDVLLRCKESNDRNGAVVTAKLRRVEALLVTLRGGEAGPRVYGAGGQPGTAARSVTLGVA